MKEHLHWSKSVSITSLLSTFLVGFIVFAGWTVTGAQWVAVADQQRELNEAVAQKNAKSIDTLDKRMLNIELTTALTRKDTESTKEDVQDIKRKVDKIYDHILSLKKLN